MFLLNEIALVSVFLFCLVEFSDLAVRRISHEGTSFVLTVDATCLAAGVLPCSAKWSPIDEPVMLGGVWHWSDDCNPIIKSRLADNNQWSPDVPVTDIVPATCVLVITVRRNDHSINHIPIYANCPCSVSRCRKKSMLRLLQQC